MVAWKRSPSPSEIAKISNPDWLYRRVSSHVFRRPHSNDHGRIQMLQWIIVRKSQKRGGGRGQHVPNLLKYGLVNQDNIKTLWSSSVPQALQCFITERNQKAAKSFAPNTFNRYEDCFSQTSYSTRTNFWLRIRSCKIFLLCSMKFFWPLVNFSYYYEKCSPPSFPLPESFMEWMLR